MDKRLGKRGERKPLVTISGHPYDVAYTTIGIGGGYYVVSDVFPSVDVDAVILELREAIDDDGLSITPDETDDGERPDVSDAAI